MKKTLFLVFLLLFSLNAFALIEHSQLKVLAVTSDGKGLGADLILDTEPGSGKIWVSADPLVGTTTQSAARTARDVAKKFSVNVEGHDYKFSIDSAASLVEGPSAGAAMALLIISALQDKQVPSNISITGTIDSAGNVGPVGGVFEKAKEAKNLGIDLFMIPRGEEIQTIRLEGRVQSINLLEYGPNNLGMKIVVVSNIDDILNFAFSDIESIDVSQIIAEGAIPDFVPEPITLEPHLDVMKQLVNNYIAETNVVIEEAKNSVSTTIIGDPVLVNTLLDTITSSEQTIKQAEILNEQNYLYSAANFAFLARVNALIVKDVSTNPSLLNLNSTALDLKVQELKKDIKSLEELLDKTVPVDFLEWHISAQQRLSYAKINAQKLSSTQVVVINGGNNFGEAFERISDFEFAVAWLDVAKDFYQITKQSNKRVRPNSAFSNSMDELLVKGEQAIASLPQETASDIERRFTAARLEKTNGWYLASMFDAATGFALGSAEKLTNGKEYSELSSMLESKINDLERKMLQSSYKFSWPSLYLVHSKYFLESARYFSESNQQARAVNSLRSGISLIMLAEQLFFTVEPVYEFYENISPSELVQVSNGSSANDFLDGTSKVFPIFSNSVLLGGFLVIVILFLIVLSFFAIQLSVDRQTVSTSKEILKVKELQRKADHTLMEGKITEDKHSELSAKYSMELALLEKQHKERVASLLELDKERSEVKALGQRLRDLKAHYKSGLITQEEFKKAHQEISSKLTETKSQLQSSKKFFETKLKQSKQIKKPQATNSLQSKQTLPVAVKTEALTTTKKAPIVVKKMSTKKAVPVKKAVAKKTKKPAKPSEKKTQNKKEPTKPKEKKATKY